MAVLKKYLHRFGHAAPPFCPECVDVEQSMEYFDFESPSFAVERIEMAALCFAGINAESIVARMCVNKASWNMINAEVTTIMSPRPVT